MSQSPVVRQILKATRKQFGAEQKIQIVRWLASILSELSRHGA